MGTIIHINPDDCVGVLRAENKRLRRQIETATYEKHRLSLQLHVEKDLHGKTQEAYGGCSLRVERLREALRRIEDESDDPRDWETSLEDIFLIANKALADQPREVDHG